MLVNRFAPAGAWEEEKGESSGCIGEGEAVDKIEG